MKTRKTRQSFYITLITVSLLTLLWVTLSQAAPFSNGSFETATPPDPGEGQVEPDANGAFTLCSIINPTFGLAERGNNIDSWTIEEGGVDWEDGNYHKPPWPGPSDGNRYLDLSSNPACSPPTGTPGGTISQTFDTIAGQEYEVYFEMSGNPDNGTGQPKRLEVSAGNDQAEYEFDFPNGETLPWQEKLFVFTAISETTVLTFQSLEDSSWGALLDNVRVVLSQAAPFSNGSFETATPPDPGEGQVEPVANGDFTLCSIINPDGGLAERGNNIASWTIEAGGVDWMDGNKSKPPMPGPSDGDRYLDLSSNPACSPPTGTPGGTISQTFDTIAGQKYEVYFDMSGNPDNGTGQPKRLRVSAGNDQAEYEFDFPNGETLPWHEKLFVFTAISETTVLTFQSLEDSSWGALLDNVWVTLSQAAPFSNGSFETATPPDPGEGQVEPVANGDFTLCSIINPDGGLAERGNNIASWTIEAGGVDWMDGNKSKPPMPGPSDGDRYLDLSSNPACSPPTGTPGGTISQTFDTIAGQEYEVYFDMSGNPDNGTGQPKRLEVSAGNDQAEYEFDFPNGETLPWQEKLFVFTAISETTVLTFQSLEDSSWGALLDNVRVVDAVYGDELGVDFDGDGITDGAIYRPSSGAWFIEPSSGEGYYVVGLGGAPNDVPVPGDYDGDGYTDEAIYRPSSGAWFIKPSSGGSYYVVGLGGVANDVPVPGDYDGDGKTDCAIYRPGSGAWFIKPSSGGSYYVVGLGGVANDVPAPGDYDGDGKTDCAIYRPSSGAWFIKPSSGGSYYVVGLGGGPNDVPAPGDYDGDGKTDCAIYRPSSGAWFIKPSSGGSYYVVGLGGVANDVPVPGDYDGDGKTDCAIYRPSSGAWFIKPSSGSGYYVVGLGGVLNDIPVNPTAVIFMKYM